MSSKSFGALFFPIIEKAGFQDPASPLIGMNQSNFFFIFDS